MFVPRLNDVPVVIGDVEKRLEDRNNETYGLDLQRHEITIIRECGMSTLGGTAQSKNPFIFYFEKKNGFDFPRHKK